METIHFLLSTFMYFSPFKQRHVNVGVTWLTISHIRASTNFVLFTTVYHSILHIAGDKYLLEE